MAAWKARATVDGDEAVDAERSLHLSATLGGRYELSGSFDAESGSMVHTALRLASTDDVEAEPVRSPSTHRADALVDVCRFFLDHHQARPARRHRPHLNVVVDYKWFHGAGETELEAARALRDAHVTGRVDAHILDLALYEVGKCAGPVPELGGGRGRRPAR